MLACAALVSVVAGVLAAACWLWATRLRTSAPGPPTWPLVGNALHFYRQPALIDRVGDLHKRYGDVFRFYVGPKLVVVVTQPEDVKRVLVTAKWQERDPYFTRTLRLVVGNGMLTSSGEIWERHRKIIEPTFHYTALDGYLETFNREADILSERLAAKGGAEFDVQRLLCLCALRIVMYAIGGMEIDLVEPDPREQELIAIKIIGFLKTFSAMMFRPWKAIDSIMWMTEDGRDLQNIISKAKELTKRYLVALREDKSRLRTHFNNLLLEEKPDMPETHDKISDEIITLAVTGTETTAGAMGYLLALLGLHPDWQEKAQRELDHVFGSGGDYLRPATSEELSQLTVIDAIIKESLRVFPTTPILPRIIDEDIPLAGGRYVAPRGCCVFAAAFLTHRDPQLYPDPEKFDPGRFLPGGSANSRKSYSYFPFGSGSRRCLGSHFASLEMKVMLAAILRRLTILPGSTREELEATVFSLTSHPLTGFRVSFVPRKEKSFETSMKELLHTNSIKCNEGNVLIR